MKRQLSILSHARTAGASASQGAARVSRARGCTARDILTSVLFLVICVFVPAAGLLLGEFGRENAEENRVLAPFPEVRSVEELLDFPEKFGDWFQDHLCFRSPMVKAEAALQLALFGEVQSEKVVFGTERPWLFHRSNDGQPMETYKRTNLFSEEDLDRISENLSAMQGEFADAGISLVLMISPDKEQVYGDRYMPGFVKRADNQGRTRQLQDRLRETCPELPVVYAADVLRAERDRGLLYYETDTHWNKEGSMLACRELLKVLDPGFTPAEYHFSETEKIRGDLQKLAGLGDAWRSTELQAEEAPLFTVTDSVQDTNGEIIWEHTLRNDGGGVPLKVYVSGDSFRWNMKRFLEDACCETTVASRYYLDLEDVATAEPDVFVYMIAERYLQELDMIPGYNTMALQR